jgi:hypothetical protein
MQKLVLGLGSAVCVLLLLLRQLAVIQSDGTSRDIAMALDWPAPLGHPQSITQRPARPRDGS